MSFLDKIYIVVIFMLLFMIHERYESYCDVCIQ